MTLSTGQLGIGKKWVVSDEPSKIKAIEHETIVSIATGARCSFAVTATGSVYRW